MEYPAVNLAPKGVKQGDYYDTRTGPYDLWAIEFGYKPLLTPEEREVLLSKSNLPEHMFANDSEDMRSPGKGIDPRAMINDLSSEPIIYAEQRIQLVNETMFDLPSKLSMEKLLLGKNTGMLFKYYSERPQDLLILSLDT